MRVQVEMALGIHGPARYGGKGYVVAVTGYGGAAAVTVKYTLGSAQRQEAGIEIGRVTKLESLLMATSVHKPKGRNLLDPSPRAPKRSSSSTPETTSTDIGDILDEGYRWNRKAGWRRRQLAVNGVTGKRLTPDEQRLLLDDHRELM